MKINTRYWVSIEKETPIVMFHSTTNTITLSFFHGDDSLVLEFSPEKAQEIADALKRFEGGLGGLVEEVSKTEG